MNITFIAQWLSGANFEIWHSSYVLARLSNTLVTREHFHANRCRHFLPPKYDVISQLRHSNAKGPFSVTQFISYKSIISRVSSDIWQHRSLAVRQTKKWQLCLTLRGQHHSNYSLQFVWKTPPDWLVPWKRHIHPNLPLSIWNQELLHPWKLQKWNSESLWNLSSAL